MQLFPICKQKQRKNSNFFDRYVHIAQYAFNTSRQNSENGFFFPISLNNGYKTSRFLTYLIKFVFNIYFFCYPCRGFERIHGNRSCYRCIFQFFAFGGNLLFSVCFLRNREH